MADFQVPYPCWLFVRKDCIAKQEDGTVRFIKSPIWVLLTSIEGAQIVPVFTHEDTASIFSTETASLFASKMIAASNSEELGDYLELIAGMYGVTFVCFDPPKDTGIFLRLWPYLFSAPGAAWAVGAAGCPHFAASG